ncbi:hypothetical protein CWC38_10425, partial [Kocuria tytonicola]|uniref:2-oxoglutarate dehydrogenase E1 subunit family protein n=1 Tax=Kocuria tytonicola TaxID=2055946 RepID=UPI000F137D24
MPDQPHHLIPEEFAGNEWLVDELYEKYRADKSSVDKKWWPIFEQMDGDDAVKTAFEKLQSSQTKIGEALYAQSQAEGAAGAQPGAEGAA